jgi:hypothetical protein
MSLYYRFVSECFCPCLWPTFGSVFLCTHVVLVADAGMSLTTVWMTWKTQNHSRCDEANLYIRPPEKLCLSFWTWWWRDKLDQCRQWCDLKSWPQHHLVRVYNTWIILPPRRKTHNFRLTQSLLFFYKFHLIFFSFAGKLISKYGEGIMSLAWHW